MPRAESKHSSAQHFYSSQFNGGGNNGNSQYMSDSATNSPSPQLSPSSQHSVPTTTTSNPPAPKKKHVCPTCDRAFTTSGHLARHSRVHTGERNHKCPFPGCETRCSRQDNLQQHYRIHLSPGSRRSSTRSAIARAMNTSSAPGKRSSTASSSTDSPSSPPPLSAPPALEPARVYSSHHSPPPDSPPALTQATLPATAQLPSGSSSRSSSSPDAAYSPAHSHLVPMSAQGLGGQSQSQGYSYRSGTATYQEQAHGSSNGFTYVHTGPVSHASNGGSGANGSFSSYSGAFGGHALPHINTSSPVLHAQHLQQQDSPGPANPAPMSSRHSISHISHPQKYPGAHQGQGQGQSSSSAGPPSPASSHSVSSHTSGPPTPSYVYHDEHAYHHAAGGLLADAGGLVQHQGYSHVHGHGQAQGHGGHSRYSSPPPTLAPIQGDRYARREEQQQQQQQQHRAYLHHPQPMPTDYSYHHQSLGLGHGAWKADSGLRKGIGALAQ